jgi:hypothetical protein
MCVWDRDVGVLVSDSKSDSKSDSDSESVFYHSDYPISNIQYSILNNQYQIPGTLCFTHIGH